MLPFGVMNEYTCIQVMTCFLTVCRNGVHSFGIENAASCSFFLVLLNFIVRWFFSRFNVIIVERLISGAWGRISGRACVCCERRLRSATTTTSALDDTRLRRSGSDCQGPHAEQHRRPPQINLSAVRVRRLRKLLGTEAWRGRRRPGWRWTTAARRVRRSRQPPVR